jgi:hypothetical protein
LHLKRFPKLEKVKMMHRVTLRIETEMGFTFARGGVEIPVDPRRGAKVDLGILFGLKPSADNRAKISSVIRTTNGVGKTIEVAILIEEDPTDAVMEAIYKYQDQNSND